MGMTKFEDVNDPGFIAVAGELRRWSKELAQSAEPPASVDEPAQMSDSRSPLRPEPITGSLGQRPHMNESSSTPIGQQRSQKMNTQGDTPNQGLTGTSYQGVPIAK
jgi:hypothetical protein